MLNVTFDVSAATGTTLIDTPAGYSIEVLGWSVMGFGDGLCTLETKDGDDAQLILDMARTKDGGGKVLTASTDGWGMVGAAGKDVVLTTSTSARVVGQVTYRSVKTS